VSDDLKLLDVKHFAERYRQAKLAKGNRNKSEDLLRGITKRKKNSIIDLITGDLPVKLSSIHLR